MPRSISVARRACAIIFVLALAALTCHRQAGAGEFVITDIGQLTPSGLNPQVAGSRVVWEAAGGTDGGSDREIFLYDGGTPTQLTENTIHDLNPRVTSTHVLWEHGTGNAAEIYFDGGPGGVPLTNNAVRDTLASVWGNRAAWVEGAATDVVLWNTAAPPENITQNLLPPGTSDAEPYVLGSDVVWVRGGRAVMRYNGISTTEVATSTFAMHDPRIEGDVVVWEGFKGSHIGGVDAEIYMHNGVDPDPIQLTNNDHPDFDPQISGGRIVWWGGVFNDNQIYLWENGAAQPITNTGLNEFPKMDGQFIVWEGWEGFDGGDLEIFVWDGSAVHQITDNDFDDRLPQISGNHIVWSGNGGVWHATFEIPEPASITLAVTALVTLSAVSLLRRRKGR